MSRAAITTLTSLASARASRQAHGITSICSAHPLVIEAALRQGLADGRPVLVEATCNQVNHQGGYTGMTPAGFRDFVTGIAQRVGFDLEQLILGGDHLGPNPWKSLESAEAMREAARMVAAYVAAGFSKIHLDTSMGCRGEPVALQDEQTAERAAALAEVAERTAERCGTAPPVYVIGTEVPVPGGALETIESLQVTTPEAAVRTVDVHREAFHARGLGAAFARVIGAVVQPGVEFGNANVVVYEPEQAQALSAVLDRIPSLVFEAHSTDYQPLTALRALVTDGFAILKVGPGLTFALREALYGLDQIAAVLAAAPGEPGLREAMEQLMLAEPGHWESYYSGTARQLQVQRHFSYSDRIRYYWTRPEAQAAVDRLFTRLQGVAIPETLISQYLAPLYPSVVAGRLAADPRALCVAAVRQVLQTYALATDSIPASGH
ncbi:D-tagatose-bisphosphate aldolase, class II, non-catalytic subunit [Frateuria aurantia]